MTGLLERMLLHLDDPRELFIAQRASRKFLDTMEGSIGLRQQLGMIHRSPLTPKETPEPLAQIHPFLYPGHRLDYGPFTRETPGSFYCCPERMDKRPCEADEPSIDYCKINGSSRKRFLLIFSLRTDLQSAQQIATAKIGFPNDHKDQVRTFDKGSWRSARVSSVPKAVEIHVFVCAAAALRCSARSEIAYREVKEGADETMTLGEMVDLLDEVRGRTGEEHLQSLDEEE